MSKALTKAQLDEFFEAVDQTDSRCIIAIHNYICRERDGNPDDEIFDMDCVDEIISLDSYNSILDVWYLFDDRFNPNDDYCWFDSYARLHSGVLWQAIDRVDMGTICDNILAMYEDGTISDIEYEISETPIADWLSSLESTDGRNDAEAAD